MWNHLISICEASLLSTCNLGPKLLPLSITCRNLIELALLYCQRIGNNALLEIGKNCKLLQALHLVDCSSIGDDAICSIARGCRNLKKLHIRRCYEVSSPFAIWCHLYTSLPNVSFCIKKIMLKFLIRIDATYA